MNIKFRFVCATRGSREAFLEGTALGRSLALYRAPFVELLLFEHNRRGLPTLYNEALRQAEADAAVLIFIHDDVHLCDFFWGRHLLEGLQVFDIIGIAGNARRLPGQPAWCFPDRSLTFDSREHLSGSVAHGSGFPPLHVERFGPPGKVVKLLDGLFLAAHSEKLLASGVRFDETFDFHFYDMDFCRQADERGLRLGTWPISVIHESLGAFGTLAWWQAYQRYLDKWKA